jgi:hypothetical protein
MNGIFRKSYDPEFDHRSYKKTNFAGCKKHGENQRPKLGKMWISCKSCGDAMCDENWDWKIKSGKKFPASHFYTEDSEYQIEIDDEQLAKNGMLIKQICDPTEEQCRIAINNNVNAIYHIKKPSNEMYLQALQKDGLVLKIISKSTSEMIFAALRQNSLALELVKDQTKEMIFMAVKKSPFAVSMIKNPNHDLYYELMEMNLKTYKFMDKKLLTPDFINKSAMIHVKKDGMLLEQFPEQTFELCTIAITQNPYAIQYIKLTDLKEIEQLETLAIEKNGMVFEYVTSASTNILKIAIKTSKGAALQFMKKNEQTYDICKEAVSYDQNNVKYILNKNNKKILSNYWYALSITKIDDCAICYSPTEKYFLKYKCNHFFCRDCTVKIAMDKQPCPMCRRPIVITSYIKNL